VMQCRCKILRRKWVANSNLSSWTENKKHKLAC
jgi:hypothetical protein